MVRKGQSRSNEDLHSHRTTQTQKVRKGIDMAKKKKTQTIGTISGLEVLRQTRPMQDIPFRTGVYSDKRKKREKVNKNKLDKWL